MSDNKNTDENQKEAVDLSELTNLQFSTAWTPSSSQSAAFGDRRNYKGGNGERADFRKSPQSREGDGRKFGKPRQRFQDKKEGGKNIQSKPSFYSIRTTLHSISSPT